MLKEISVFLNDLFGDAGKWVLLGVLGILLLLCITLVVFIALNIKWILLGGSSAAILAVLTFFVAKRINTTD